MLRMHGHKRQGPHTQTLPAPSSDGLIHRGLTWFAACILFVLNLLERFALPWHWWPLWTGVGAVRLNVRRRLYEHTHLLEVPMPEDSELARRVAKEPVLRHHERLLYRTGDGYGTDGAHPGSGAAGHPLGRNMAIVPEALRNPSDDPTPQLVAQKLLARRPNPRAIDETGFIPAGMQLNVLSAAWIQANLHGWLDHMVDRDTSLKFSEGASAGCPMNSFILHPTKNAAAGKSSLSGNANETGADGAPEGPDTVYLNPRTAWWDASFLYGQSEAAVRRGRTGAGGRLHVADDGVAKGAGGAPLVGDQINTWVGITLLQDLLAREHNAVAAAIAAATPYLTDEEIFRKARLATSAVIAKIHTIDWTVELLKTPILSLGMHGQWKGLMNLGPKGLGLVGKPKADTKGVPYNLTEEFAAIYRMHPMLPDTLPIEEEAPVDMRDLLAEKGLNYLKENGREKLWQSLVRFPGGALELFNFPESLRDLVAETGDEDGNPVKLSPIDLAAVDIYRDRERGIPRYNAFREQLNMPRMKSWEELTGGDAFAVSALREVYGEDIDKCDLLVGNLAEKKIPGFAISETAFMIFLIMASRRLEADRFYTEHFTEEVYGKVGMQWVRETNSMRDVLARHFPEIEKEIPPNTSAFTPYVDL